MVCAPLCDSPRVPIHPPERRAAAQQLNRRHQRGVLAYTDHQSFTVAPLRSGFAVSKSLTTGCRKCHNSKPQFLYKVPAHIDGCTLSLSCNGNCHHEVEHKIILTYPTPFKPDPAPGNCGSLIEPLLLLPLCSAGLTFSVGKTLSSPLSSSSPPFPLLF